MERAFAQFIPATAQTLLEFAMCIPRQERIEIPRTSLTISAAILSVFSDLNPRETLKRIGGISPLMIALNERADIGVSAKLEIEKGRLSQNQLWGLILLEDQTQKELERRKREFLQKYPQDRDITEAVIKDFITLSGSRSNFSIEEWPKFLELDSAIFVCAYIHMANPKILKDAGIDLSAPAETKEEIEKKYNIFITPDTDKLTFTQRKLRTLLAAEMLLKVNDDLNDQKGMGIDKLLNLPSFARYANHYDPNNPRKALREIKRHYEKEASMIFPKPIQKIAERTRSLTSILKAQRSKDGLRPSNDPTNFWRCFARESQTTTLRHELEAMNVISGLFCSNNQNASEKQTKRI